MILVDLLVNGSSDVLMLSWETFLMDDSRGNGFVNSRVMVTRLSHEVLDGGSGFVHDEEIGVFDVVMDLVIEEVCRKSISVEEKEIYMGLGQNNSTEGQ